MKKSRILLLVALFSVINWQLSQAQVTTKYGDDVSTLNGIMKAYYDVVTVKKGEKIDFV